MVRPESAELVLLLVALNLSQCGDKGLRCTTGSLTLFDTIPKTGCSG